MQSEQMIYLQTRDRGRVEEKESWVDSLREVKTMEGGEVAEDEEERAEAGEAEKERGVMAKDKEVREEAGVVEKETYKCSDCEKHYAFLNKLQHHKPWSCKKKKR